MESGYYRKKKVLNWRGAVRKLLRNRKLLVALGIALPLAGYMIFGTHGLVRRATLLHQKAELQQRIEERQDEITRLRAESRALDGDRRAIEKVAREKYGLVREGETLYRVHPAP